MKKTLLCLGYGYTAGALARRLEGEERWRVIGTTRGPRAGEAGLLAWGRAGEAVAEADAILVSVPPDAEGCPVLRALADALAARAGALGWVGYLSSTAVYGDHEGGWVDERSELKAASPRGLARIRAEADWAAFGAEYAASVVIFRLAGLYGPGRSALDALREGRAQRIVKDGQVFNRIHVDDAAAALAASLADPGAGGLFNLADDEPAPPQDVVAYAAKLLGVAAPPETAFADAALGDVAREFYTENKRVRNGLVRRALRLSLAYPTYREGLCALAARA